VTAPKVAPRHLAALDGLRGFAALVVVLRHSVGAFDVSPATMQAIMLSPLVLLQNAVGAVQLFFVLSGFVLAGSVERNPAWRALPQYFVRRLFRIHPPYVFAVLVAWGASFFYADFPADVSNVLFRKLASVHITPAQLGGSLLFPGTAHYQFVVGWSLEVELIFSLLLPAMLWLARRVHWLALIALSGAALLVGTEGHRVLKFALDFSLGIALYLERDGLRRLLGRLRGLRAAAFIAAGVVLFHLPWFLGWQPKARGLPDSIVVMGFGAALLVAAAAFHPASARFFSLRPLHELGRVSYSLYLLHYPIVVLVAGLVVRPDSGAGDVFCLIALVLGAALPLSWAMYHAVERPAIAAGNALVRALAGRLHQEALRSRLLDDDDAGVGGAGPPRAGH